jgi:hypothetical protein
LAIDAYDVLHFDLWKYGDDIVDAISNDRAVPKELVPGIVPSHGKLPPLQDLQTKMERFRAEVPEEWQIRRISTSCGLGAESVDNALRRMKQLNELRDALNG